MKGRPTRALILGAAEGLGEAFAKQLSTICSKIWLVDILERELEQCAQNLRMEGQAIVECLHMDLGEPTAAEELEKLITRENIDLLVYVAAHSRVGRFLDLAPEDVAKTLAVNNHTLARVCYSFGNYCRANQRKGGIILISSLAGWWGLPDVALYGASKAFIWNLAEGLNAEWKPHGIDVLGLICGAMHTPAFRRSKPNIRGLPMEDVDQTAKEGLAQLGKRSLWVAGRKSRLSFLLLNRILPRSLTLSIMRKQLIKMYQGKIR